MDVDLISLACIIMRTLNFPHNHCVVLKFAAHLGKPFLYRKLLLAANLHNRGGF